MANIELKEADIIDPKDVEILGEKLLNALLSADIEVLDILADVSKAVLRLRMERGECLDERTSVDSVDLPGR